MHHHACIVRVLGALHESFALAEEELGQLDCGALRHISTLADASRTVPVEHDRKRRGGHAREDRTHAEPVLVALRSVPHTREVPDDAPVRALAACGCLVHAA